MIVVYIVVGIVLLLVMGVAVFLWARKRTATVASLAQQQDLCGNKDYHALASPTTRVLDGDFTVNPETQLSPPGCVTFASIEDDPEFARFRIPYAQLSFTRIVSKGAFGEVWLAEFDDRQVAVKCIYKYRRSDEKEIEYFATEIKLMASLCHPKIVEFLGVSWDTIPDLCAVAEYMPNGDLWGYLRRNKGNLTWPDHKIHLAEDIADALSYLHSRTPVLMHRDLKPRCVMMDDSLRAKLSHFGIDRKRVVEETMCAGIGPIQWTAPEVLMGEDYTEKADIYSFGIIMSELDTHEIPYSDLRDEAGRRIYGMKIIFQVIKRNLRPTFSSTCPDTVRELAALCMAADPNERPDATELLCRVQEIRQQLIRDVVAVSVEEDQLANAVPVCAGASLEFLHSTDVHP